ncbi:MAG: transposase [bacterium]
MLQGHVGSFPICLFLDVLETGALGALLFSGNEGRLVSHPLRGDAEDGWRSLLMRLREAEGVAPTLICCSGDPAAIRAIRAAYPDALIQISLSHRLLVLGGQLSPRSRGQCLAEGRRIFSAPDRASAVVRFRAWRDLWLSRGEQGVRSLERDLGWCLTFYRFPPDLRRTLRSLRLLRRACRAARAVQAPSPSLSDAPPSEGHRDVALSHPSESDGILVLADDLITDPPFAQRLQQYRRDRLQVAQTASALASAVGLAARLLGRGQ